jgi:hypothetical protein
MLMPSLRRVGACLGGCALALTVACGGSGGSGGSGSTRSGGGQTSDFGSGDEDICLVTSSETVSLERARERGHAVDAQLALVPAHFDAPFHRGPFPCGSTPSVTGTIAIDTTLERIVEQEREPAPNAPRPVTCPRLLQYEMTFALATDEGTLAGAFPATVFADPDRLFAYASAAADVLRGSLDLRVNLARPHTAVVSTQLTFTADGVSGQAFSHVSYDDGSARESEQGDGIFWPTPGNDTACYWLTSDVLAGSELISLDAYRTRN